MKSRLWVLMVFAVSFTLVFCAHATHGQPRVTAKHVLASTVSLVLTRAFSAELSSIQSSDVDSSGSAFVWMFVYFSFDTSRVLHRDSVYYVVAQNDVVRFDHSALLGYGPYVLVHPWMNSDSAVSFAREALGSEVIQRFPASVIKVELWQQPAPPFISLWQIAFFCSDSTRTVNLDATTGDVISRNAFVTSVEGYVGGLPPRYPELFQNYPNPFNPTTIVRYGLPAKSQVTLTVLNTLGQQVATLVNEVQDAGYHDVRFDGSGLASGVYFYRLQAGDFVQTKRLLLLR